MNAILKIAGALVAVVGLATPALSQTELTVPDVVQTVILNYMALHGEQGLFNGLFGSALGTGASLDGLIAFNQITSGTV